MGRVELVNLRNVLSSLYRTNARALELADQAGLAIEDIDQPPRPKSQWWEILRAAERMKKLQILVQLAIAEHPTHKGLALAAQGKLVDVDEGDADLDWVADAKTTEEVMIGSDDLLPALFLEVGGKVATCVVRIALDDGSFGSGFLIANDLVLTNRHVLPDKDSAALALFHVGAQTSLDGRDFPGRKIEGRPEALFYADDELDWAIVRVDPVANASPVSLSTIATIRPKERLFIIQHPGGGPKQVALGVNKVMYVDDTRIQYLTDTMPGSSGSPLFDRNWTLVGIHRQGGWLLEPSSKQERFRNEGIPIAPIRDTLRARGIIA